MKPSLIDFAPRANARKGLAWLVSGSSTLLVVAGLVFWQMMPQEDVIEPRQVDTTQHPAPGRLVSADAALRNLNLPWLEALDVLEAIFEKPADGALLNVDTSIERFKFRVSGEARDPGIVQDIPSRLKALESVADVVLIGQDWQNNPRHPVLFTLEFRMREPS